MASFIEQRLSQPSASKLKDQVVPLKKKRTTHHTLSIDQPIPVYKLETFSKQRGYTEKRVTKPKEFLPRHTVYSNQNYERVQAQKVVSCQAGQVEQKQIEQEAKAEDENTTAFASTLEEEKSWSKETEKKEKLLQEEEDLIQKEQESPRDNENEREREDKKVREERTEEGTEGRGKEAREQTRAILEVGLEAKEELREYEEETKKKKYSQNEVINGIFQELLQDLEHFQGFQLKKEDKKSNVKLFVKTYPEGPLKEYPRYIIQLEEVIGVFPHQILDLLSRMDKQDEWNKHCKLCTKLGKIEDTEVSFTHLKIPFPLSDRGFLERRIDVAIGDSSYVMLTSAGTQSVPIPNKKITIGYTFLSAYIVKPVRVNGEVIGSSLTFVNHGNFGGSVPKSFVRMFAAKNVMEYITTVVKEAKKRAL